MAGRGAASAAGAWLLALVPASVSACRTAATADGGADRFAPHLPQRFPAGLPVDDFVGARACAECHPNAYASWAASPHGRAMAEANPDTVLGAFDGRPVALPDGVVVPLRRGSDFAMEIRRGAETETHGVELVLASGRQQQIYLARPDGVTVRRLSHAPLVDRRHAGAPPAWASSSSGSSPNSSPTWRGNESNGSAPVLYRNDGGSGQVHGDVRVIGLPLRRWAGRTSTAGT